MPEPPDPRHHAPVAPYLPPAYLPTPGAPPPLPVPHNPERGDEPAARAFRKPRLAWLAPGAASAVPFAAGRLWYAHGGHGLADLGIGGLAVVGVGVAVAFRADPDTAAWTAALSVFVLDFAICAYATEAYLPLGLFALATAAAYTAAARVWRRDARRADKRAERREHHQLDAATTVQVQQIKAQRDVAVAAIRAQAAVKVAEAHATAYAAAGPAPYPLLELDPTARAMLTLDPRVKALLERRPLYELEAGPAAHAAQDAGEHAD